MFTFPLLYDDYDDDDEKAINDDEIEKNEDSEIQVEKEH